MNGSGLVLILAAVGLGWLRVEDLVALGLTALGFVLLGLVGAAGDAVARHVRAWLVSG